ncbi:MAG TPA: BamA/TamA family outer membrane protein [Parafilimonas sp.]|nr:BamA/TamA family outer membrane protein [Parafilimonas sp.]
MKFASITLAVLLFSFSVYAQDDSVQARIVVIGDAGSFHKDAQGHDRHYVVSAVKKTIPLDEKTTVLYVGDNLYYTGLPDNALKIYDIRRQVLDSQMDIALGTKAKVYFIPGNHDWDVMRAGGWEAIKREQEYIDTAGRGKNVDFEPKGGCPGPVEVPINDNVVMILMDSQWWLHQYDKPGIESDCSAKTRDQVISELGDMIERNSQKLILFAEHHPLKSYGIHGGYFTWKQHLFPLTDENPHWYLPLPIIGSIYPITRSVFGTPQDLPHPTYQNMIAQLQSVLKQHVNVIYLAGHEHNLQLIKDSTSYYVISGSGTNKTRVGRNKNLLFGARENGFMVLTVSKNKNVNFSYYTVFGDSVVHAYDSTLVNFSNLPKDNIDTVKSQLVKSELDSIFSNGVLAKVHPEYDSVSGLQKFFLGSNYRKEWAIPVHMSVFNIEHQNGGFTIKSLGGGKQTASLHLTDKKGESWLLRSINKNPSLALPENLRGTIAQSIVQDMISASHPYAPLAIAPLANAMGVPEAAPKLFYVPDDPSLGIYRSKFRNQVVMLEESEPTINGENAIGTDKVMDNLFDDNDNRVEQHEVLRARLVDMWIGDFDRHAGQWKWGKLDTGKGKLYYAIPRDRDQAFFYSDGLLLKLATIRLLPFLKGFKDNVQNQRQFNYVERNFDRFFLNRLDKNDWQQALQNFQKNETDSVITKAVHQMPPEIVAHDGNDIIHKLESRRALLAPQVMKYYNFLSKKVTVVGSNDKEYFHVFNVNDSLEVDVYKRKKKSLDTSSLMYRRVFDPSITKEIRLYGLNNDDYFKIDPNTHSKIRLRIIGGKGNDTFDIDSKTNNYIYDVTLEKNNIVNPRNSKIRTSSNPIVNDYTPDDFEYNVTRFPNFNFGYNPDDGVLFGLGFLRRTYGFRKDPYATEQKLSTYFAPTHGSYELDYYGIFNHAFGKEDIVVNSTITDPVLNNFFGPGNNTKIDQTKSIDYYRVRYRYTETDLMLRKRFNPVLSLMVGPTFYHYWNAYNDNSARILAKPSLIGLDSADVYSKKTYAGGKATIVVNNLDNVLLPTRGINWVTTFTTEGGLSKNSQPYTSLTTDMAVHGALTDPANWVAVVRLGAGKIYSKHYEYFQLLNLGANNFLRGFRKDRFSGTSMAYASAELRVKLFHSNFYLLPGEVGLVGFNDVGRVWLRGEHSERWHDSYGGGIYYAAYNYVLLSATIGFSQEEKLFNFSLGTKFNITF